MDTKATVSVLALAMSGALLLAQESATGDVLVTAPAGDAVKLAHTVALPLSAAGAQADVMWVAAEVEGKVVKGAPYSAEEVTETRQTLADGNRISNRNTALVYRDGEGRVRRERTLTVVGPLVAAGAGGKRIITITDPVAGVTYSLDPETKTARKLPAAGVTISHSAEGSLRQEVVEKRVEIVGAGAGPVQTRNAEVRVVVVNPGPESQPAKETLGTQVIEGVSAEGTRVTVTIPAGQIGNERPIQTISETWYSPQLQTVVMSKQSDPRMGETVFRLTNINLGEPSPTLFQIPPDYKIVEGKTLVFSSEERKP